MFPRHFALHGDPSSRDSHPAGLLAHARSAAFVAVGMLGCIPPFFLGRQVWDEWCALGEAEKAVADTTIVGYPNIYPAITRADKPAPWCRVEGDRLLVWSGWEDGRGHTWFNLGRDECDPTSLGDPIGRDVARAIDYPAIEHDGGSIWGRIPPSAEVVGFNVGTTRCAYPVTVLAKVLIVNDAVDGTPRLVHFDPFVSPDESIATYDPRIDGRRITLGSGGFSVKGRHVLYDRGTQSLWAGSPDGLLAFSGPYKGKKLPLLDHGSRQTWAEWREENPDSRLLVGSLDRKAGIPSE